MTAVTALSIANVPSTVSLRINSISGSSSTYTYDASALVRASQDLWLSGGLAVQV